MGSSVASFWADAAAASSPVNSSSSPAITQKKRV